MAFLIISKSYWNTLMEQLFLCLLQNFFHCYDLLFFFPAKAVLYLNDWELLRVKSALLVDTLSLLNCRKLPNVSEELSLYSIKLFMGIECKYVLLFQQNIINYCFTCRKWCTIFKRNICIIACIYCYISCN